MSKTHEVVSKILSDNNFEQFTMNKGDVSIHHSLSIHDSLPNNSENSNRFAITLKVKSCDSNIDRERFDKYKNSLLNAPWVK